MLRSDQPKHKATVTKTGSKVSPSIFKPIVEAKSESIDTKGPSLSNFRKSPITLNGKPQKTNSTKSIPLHLSNSSELFKYVPRGVVASPQTKYSIGSQYKKESLREASPAQSPATLKLIKNTSVVSLSSVSTDSTRPNSKASTKTSSVKLFGPLSRESAGSSRLMKTSNPQQRNSMGEASLAVTKVKLEHVNGKVDLALMISKNGVNPDMSREQILEHIAQATHVRLDRSAIRTLTGITAWKHITHLQLQHNHLSSLAPLAGLHKLRILSVAANELTSIDGLSNLLNLRYLDASENRMADFNAGWFPASLESLDLSANPCATAPDHRLRIIYACKYLAVLDTQDVTREELRLARMSLGNDEERLAAFDQMPEMGRGSELEDDDVPETRPGDEGMTWDLGGTHASSSDSISNFPLEPFKKTVDDIIERSRVRQADTDKDSKSRMEALITQIRADGASRSCRLREIIQSLN